MSLISSTYLGLAAGLVAAIALSVSPALAKDGHHPREGVIAVTGEGHAALAPDMALVTLSVVRTEKTAREAMDGVNSAMASVLKAIRESGVADKDLQTSGFSIQPQYVYPEDNNGQPPKLTGYQVANSLSVRVRDITKLGGLLDRAVTLGVNQGGDIRFTNDHPEQALQSARTAAMKDAMAKAKTLAEASGVTLGRIVEIAENPAQGEPMPMARMAMAKESADAAPVATGENSYNVSVNLTIAIAP